MSHLSKLGSSSKTVVKYEVKPAGGPAQQCTCGAIKPSDYIFCDECGKKL
jgi:hypothetical protein